MKRILSTLLLLATVGAGRTEDAPAIGQPTIFWRNNEWQVFQNGRWVAYAEAAREKAAFEAARAQAAEAAAAEAETPEAPAVPDSGNVQTNDYEQPWPYGYVMDLPTSGNPVQKRRHGHKPHVPGFGQPALGIGQPNMQIGQPNFTPGQMTPGIGQQATLGQQKAANCPARTPEQTTLVSGQRTIQSPARIVPVQHAFSKGQPAGFSGSR